MARCLTRAACRDMHKNLHIALFLAALPMLAAWTDVRATGVNDLDANRAGEARVRVP
jgi:hypothetical protein